MVPFENENTFQNTSILDAGVEEERVEVANIVDKRVTLGVLEAFSEPVVTEPR